MPNPDYSPASTAILVVDMQNDTVHPDGAYARARHLQTGSWGAQIVDELAPRPTEVVLDRTRMSVFNGTAIDNMLRSLGIRTLIVVGAWTNMAVEHTVRDAADHGSEVTLVEDATSSLSAEWQHAAVSFALTNIATLSDTATVTTALAG